jgi:4-amino-4-deoxy-L-arabinose transferase-like glycosyltransferase
MLLAFALRAVIIADRARSDWAWEPPPGTDQATYVRFAAGCEAGTWPDGPFRWQPGIVYYLVGVRALVGDSLVMMRLVTALTGALGCGWMVAVGWLLTRRRWGGWLAGLLLAVYPVTAFYATELLTEGLAVALVCLFLLLALWWRERPSPLLSLAVGLTLGAITITRTNLALLWPVWALLALLESRRLRPFAVHTALSLMGMALLVAPVTLYNRAAANGGPYPLVSSTGMDEVYRGSNRDADGLRSGPPAMGLVDDEAYGAMLLADLWRDPLRFLELQLFKAGLYWSAHEPGNNISYAISGAESSALLRLIPLDFRRLALLGWLGVFALAYAPAWEVMSARRRLALFFALLHLVIFIGVMPLWAEGRLKQPAVPPLVACAVCLLLALGDGVRQRDWRGLLRRYGLPLLLVGGTLLWLDAGMRVWPRQRPAALPADLRPLDVTFDSALVLRGWRPLPEWPAADQGWTRPGRSVVVQLFWEVRQPVTADYNFYLAWVVDGERRAGFDRAIGGVSYKPHPTSRWQPGDTYAEIAGFRLPPDAPLEVAGDIRLGVYTVTGELTPFADTRAVTNVRASSLPDTPESIRLLRLAAFDAPLTPDPIAPARADFGGLIGLDDWTFPERGAPGQAVELALAWRALADIPADYTLFVHLIAANGQLAAQADAPPRGDRLPTSTWPPDYRLMDAVSLRLPETPGIYTLALGWYNPLTGERLPLAGAVDGRLLPGMITVGG